MDKQKWVYRSEYFYGNLNTLDTTLNSWAKEGYELVQILETNIMGNDSILIIWRSKL
jgi:hypothetical protein